MVKKEFVRKIDIPHIAELISERFDNALELMGKNSLVYGGAVRDIIAELPIEGDLDIVTNNSEYHQVIAEFHSSPKWIKIGRNGKAEIPKFKPNPIGKRSPNPEPAYTKYKPFNRSSGITFGERSSNPYEESIPMVETMSFETFDNARVQVVRALPEARHEIDLLKASLELARGADLRCCSIAVNYVGTVFELVDGAYVDCKNRVLRINRIEDPNRYNNLEARIEKLKKRGWTSKINLEKVKKQIEKIKKTKEAKRIKEEEDSAKKAASKRRDRVDAATIAAECFKIQYSKNGEYILNIDKELSNIIGKQINSIIRDINDREGLNITRVPSDRPNYSAFRLHREEDIHMLAEYFAFVWRNTGVPSAKGKTSWARYKVVSVNRSLERLQKKTARVARMEGEMAHEALIERTNSGPMRVERVDTDSVRPKYYKTAEPHIEEVDLAENVEVASPQDLKYKHAGVNYYYSNNGLVEINPCHTTEEASYNDGVVEEVGSFTPEQQETSEGFSQLLNTSAKYPNGPNGGLVVSGSSKRRWETIKKPKRRRK